MAESTLPLEDEAEVVELPDDKPEPQPEPQPAAMVPVQTAEATLMRELWIVAERVASTEFVPSSLRGKPDKVFAAVLAGREIGLGPMAALKVSAVM